MGKRKTLVVLVVLFLLPYVASYLYLSRRGLAEGKPFGIKGFYYFFPADSNAWRFKENGCRYLFYPLNVLDKALGTGQAYGSEPIFHLGGGKK
jgi:hypothetical protein